MPNRTETEHDQTRLAIESLIKNMSVIIGTTTLRHIMTETLCKDLNSSQDQTFSSGVINDTKKLSLSDEDSYLKDQFQFKPIKPQESIASSFVH